MKKIKSLTVRDDHGQDNFYIVGKNGVELIVEHQAQVEGDKWFYDVQTATEVTRIFNATEVVFDREVAL